MCECQRHPRLHGSQSRGTPPIQQPAGRRSDKRSTITFCRRLHRANAPTLPVRAPLSVRVEDNMPIAPAAAAAQRAFNAPTRTVARATFGAPPRRTLELLNPCPQTLAKHRSLICKSSDSCPENGPKRASTRDPAQLFARTFHRATRTGRRVRSWRPSSGGRPPRPSRPPLRWSPEPPADNLRLSLQPREVSGRLRPGRIDPLTSPHGGSLRPAASPSNAPADPR